MVGCDLRRRGNVVKSRSVIIGREGKNVVKSRSVISGKEGKIGLLFLKGGCYCKRQDYFVFVFFVFMGLFLLKCVGNFG